MEIQKNAFLSLFLQPVGIYAGKYQWSGNNKHGDCSLEILDVDITFDDGVWECQVTSTDFKSQDSLASKPARLVVRVAPESVAVVQNKNRLQEGEQITVINGKQETIHCESRQSNPAPVITWFLGENEIPVSLLKNLCFIAFVLCNSNFFRRVRSKRTSLKAATIAVGKRPPNCTTSFPRTTSASR